LEGNSSLKVLTFFPFFFALASLASEMRPYEIEASLRDTTLRISLKTRSSARINQDAPISLEVKSQGLTFPKTKLTRHDAKTSTEHELLFELRGSPRDGTKTASGRLSFYLCTIKSCRKIEEDFKVH
jgi:hypothetical protein